MFRLLFIEPGNHAAVTAGLVEDPFNPLVAGPGDLEIDRVDAVRNVETVILLIPMAGTAFDDLDTGFRLGRTPTWQRLTSDNGTLIFSDPIEPAETCHGLV